MTFDEFLTLVKNKVPAISEDLELKAIISHMIHNPKIQYPGVESDKNFCDLKKLIRNNKIEMINNYPSIEKSKFTFIDLFAGIGGFRQAFQGVGGQCVFSCEWDKYAKQTYFANYGEVPFGDIRLIDKRLIPEHDVLCAGFPCQPFSIAGVSKNNSMGRATGLDDNTQGTLFFEIKEILRLKRPKAFMLENVKNLVSHNQKKTFKIICAALHELEYEFHFEVIDGQNWVPQHRERIFIVGYDPKQVKLNSSINIPLKPDSKYIKKTLDQIILSNVAPRYTLGPGTWEALKRHKSHHQSVGNGFGYNLKRLPILPTDITRTISARYYKDGAEILIEQSGGLRPRRLTVEEAMQLQGFDPQIFIFPVSDGHAYRQIGNSVVIPAITAAAREITKNLQKNKE